MAVEAHHLLPLFASQLLGNQEIVSGIDQDQSNIHDMQLLGYAGPLLPLGDSSALLASENGGLYGKRPRESFSFIGEDFSSNVQQQLLHLDRLILNHVAKVRMELAQRLRRILATAEEAASKRLKEKDEEVERERKVTLALEERVKSLCVENQMWRELARSSEAVALALRADLERTLAATVKAQAAAAEDAESCCCGDSEEEARRACRCCGEREPEVLLLPCRHLCVCAACGPAVATCPVCDCRKNGSVLVNMS
ncbi:probable BOI-related E3 ubiquitin-protein ligase 3 [Zingiber officinale]|uniref:probable BOI-related E3 ubiquitin-protein ligase 3 n=1 Tax=Zingiber officinale TaxID=94328 RepID=UPI001C4CFB24|nr:probable BOI-related E3 ubiquitin-protein ligase 3 [Zingiber officinale]XP_042442638.1 probable BOI-related E3 ubiquitin-protein ligase 3 [Zingiber officinale]XP_042442644.1 probable BOI-related E3 ubiquitin-protein ligase 3 [Zingiber officinale]